MKRIEEARISKEILDAYHKKFSDHIESDVIIVGAGPSGLIAATYLSQEKFKVAVIEKRLSPGGGIWGGGMAMNEIVVQDEAISLLDEFEIRHHATQDGLHTVDAMELASGLCYRALRAGAAIFNVMTAEDVCIHDERVTGVVVNRSLVFENLPVDPLMMTARAVVDATGHEAALVQFLRKRRMLDAAQNRGEFVEGALNATQGEQFVVDRVTEFYPGLWVSGMSLCAAFGGPRMGPIFGGMMLSGKKVAELIAKNLKT